MDLDVYQEWFEPETEHWWFVERRNLFLQLIELTLGNQKPLLAPPLRIADIGCGTGVNLDALSKFGKVIGVDFSGTALAFCRNRNKTLLCQAPMASLPFGLSICCIAPKPVAPPTKAAETPPPCALQGKKVRNMNKRAECTGPPP